MRIIITNQGHDMIKSMNYEKYTEDHEKYTHINTKTNQNTENSEEKNKVNFYNNNDLTENMKTIKNIKFVEIKPKKISIPKNIAEKYNEINLGESTLLPSIYKDILKIPANEKKHKHLKSNIFEKSNNTEDSQQSNNYNPNNVIKQDDLSLRTSYKINEILSDQAINNMKNNIFQDLKMKNKLSNIREAKENFRNPFLTPKEKLIDIECALEKKIKSDKANIIQYLNSKNNLSPKFIKSLSNYDEDKFIKFNKICQRAINQDEMKHDMNIKINGIIDNMHLYQKAEYKQKMNLMEKEVKSIKNICDKYPKREDKEIYENLLQDMKKKYWDKPGVEKLYSKKNNKEH